MLRLDAAAEYTGLSERFLRREAIPKYDLRHYRPPGGRLILFRRSDLDALLESWRVGSTDPMAKPDPVVRRVVGVVADEPGITRPAIRKALTNVNRERSDAAINAAVEQGLVRRTKRGGTFVYSATGRRV